jgi:GNAT superfamily N-acetyltransferase
MATASKTTKKKSSSLVLRELKKPADWQAMFRLIKQLNKSMTKKQYDGMLADMLARGYRAVGAYQGDTLVGVSGFWVSVRFWCHKYIDIDNVVVDEKIRSKGIGAKLIAWIEKEGRRQKCEMSMLDCYTTHHKSHRFYFRQGYCILGYHFTKDL